ncbi:MAG: ACT domain-containing protein [Sphaerochaeta sp.]
MKTNQGETDLRKMLANLQPILSEERYVYCFLDYQHTSDFPVWASICEQEGRTLIMAQEEADRQGLPYEGIWSRITLSVHSSLQAVGLTAHVSTLLADAGISANMVAGYYHDHVFVQAELATLACDLLQEP